MKGYQAFLVVLSMSLLSVFCLKPPAAPSWDSDVNVPLFAGGFLTSDLLRAPVFTVQADSTVALNVSYSIDTIHPAEAVRLLAVDTRGRIAVGDFLLAQAGQGRLSLALSDVAGIPIPDSGLKAQVEPFENSFVRYCPLDRIAEAEIATGVLSVMCENHTAVPFDRVSVLSGLGPVEFGSVPAFGSVTARVRADGGSVQSPMELSFDVHSPGTGGDTVRLGKYDSLVVRVELDSVRLSSARLRLPACSGQRRCQVPLSGSRPLRIDSVTLSAGSCLVTVSNELDVALDAVLHVPRLAAAYSRHLPARGSTVVELGLAGLRVDNRSRTNSLLEFEVTAVPDTSAGFVSISKADGVSVVCHSAGLESREVAGEFLQPVYVVSGQDTVLRVPLGISGLRVPDADVVFELESEVGFPVELEVRGVAERAGSPVASVERVFRVEPGRPGAARRSGFTLPAADLVNAGPDLVLVEYNARIVGVGAYQAGSTLWGRAALSTPVRVALAPDTIASPARLVTLGESERELVGRHIVGGSALLRVANHLPVGVAGLLVVRPDSSAVRSDLTVVDSVTLEFDVPAGAVGDDGFCVAPTETDVTCELDTLDATLLHTWPLSAKLVLLVPETDTVVLRGSDGLALDALLGLRIRVGE